MLIQVSDREFHCVLSGLRCLQHRMEEERFAGSEMESLVTDAGRFSVPSLDSINELCERINTAPQRYIVIRVRCGRVDYTKMFSTEREAIKEAEDIRNACDFEDDDSVQVVTDKDEIVYPA